MSSVFDLLERVIDLLEENGEFEEAFQLKQVLYLYDDELIQMDLSLVKT